MSCWCWCVCAGKKHVREWTLTRLKMISATGGCDYLDTLRERAANL